MEIKLILQYGQEPMSARIVDAILKKRSHRPIETTTELARLIDGVVPLTLGFKKRQKTKARIFQAIRIEVNDEVYADY